MATSLVRQAILRGPIMDGSARPSFFNIPGVPSGYVPVTQNISAAHPLIVTAARGFGKSGPVDRIGMCTTNLTWPEVPHDDAFFLYVDVTSTGALVPGFTTLGPIYQEYGVPSIVAGQHTYNILEATMYVGDGSAAHPVSRVFLGYGWGSATQGRIAALRPYAYLGRWTSELFPFPAPGACIRLDDDKIGGPLLEARWVAVCMANDGHYDPGNELTVSSFPGSFAEITGSYVRLDATLVPPTIRNATDGSLVNLDPSKWRMKCYLTRSW